MSYGKSLALSQNNFVQPPEKEEVDETFDARISRQKRQATVYDAVAGKYILSRALRY